jgi:hypothetical protein
MWAELSAASSLADERPRREIASPNLFDAARARIHELLASPLDAILADIEREDIEEGARTTPLVGAPSLPSTVDGSIQKVRPRTQPSRRTGRRSIPRAPSSSVEVPPPTHPYQMLEGLHKPASTMLARATSLCCSVVSSTTPSLMAPPTPSLLPFTFLCDVVHSSSGGGATYPFRASSPPRRLMRRKPRPRRVCLCHGPRAPNQVEPLLCEQHHRPRALLCGRRHRPRAPNQSTRDGWD